MEKKLDAVQAIDSTIQFVFQIGIELYYGLRYRTIPITFCLFIGFIFNLCVVLHWDYFFLKNYHLGFLYPVSPELYWPYYLLSATTGFWLWAIFKVLNREKRKKELQEAFQSVGLKTQHNKTPQLICDRETLPGVFKLDLKAPGFSQQSFTNVKDNLQTQLGIFIDEIKENIEKKAIEVIYAKKELKFPFTIGNIHSIPSDTFIVGKSRAREVRADLVAIPHILIAGETDGGKSTFQRQLATSLYLNNPLYEFILIDLKEGLEFQLFENLPRVTVVTDVSKALTELIKLPEILKHRMGIIRSAGCVNIQEYLAKTKEKAAFNRLVIIVDEIAELFLSGYGRKSQQTQLVRNAVGQLARQGRAVGIHIILATQRPEVKVIDPQIKANLIATICFPTPNNETSITALGNGRATHLPMIKGRALWKVGSQMTEVQTPLLKTDEVKLLLQDKKSATNPKESVTATINSSNSNSQVALPALYTKEPK